MKDYRKTVRHFLSPKRTGLLLGAVLLMVATGIVACTEMVGSNETPTADAPTPQATADEPVVFMVVEDMPNIKGGMQTLYDALEYPAAARKAGIEGKVYVQFTVDEEGNVVDPVIMKSPDELLSRAALEAVKKINFEPGKQRGQAVKVRLSLPIRFVMSDGETSPSAAVGLLEGQVEAGDFGIEEREMAFRNLEFSGNTVTGRIVDATTGQPLPGANVVVQGHRQGRHAGAATDADGWFTIHADTPIQQITASFVGYEPMKAQQR